MKSAIDSLPIFLAARSWVRLDEGMRTAFSQIFSFALVSTIAISHADDKTSPPVGSSASPYAPIAFFVGGTWHGQLPPSPKGQKMEIEMKADWTANHQGIRFDSFYVVDGKRSPYTSGMYAWNAAKKQILFFYSDDKGGLVDGGVTIENGVLVHDFNVTEKDGQVSKVRARITQQGSNTYLNEIFLLKDNRWDKFVSVRYERAD